MEITFTFFLACLDFNVILVLLDDVAVVGRTYFLLLVDVAEEVLTKWLEADLFSAAFRLCIIVVVALTIEGKLMYMLSYYDVPNYFVNIR